MKRSEVERIKSELLADIELSLANPFVPEVGGKMHTPIGEGTITKIDGTTIWVQLPHPITHIDVTVELAPPSPERGPHCDWCGEDVDPKVAYQDECGDYYCENHGPESGAEW